MLKKALILLIVLTLMSGCIPKNDKISIGDSMNEINNNYKPFISLNALTVYKINDIYIVIVQSDDKVQKRIEFTSDRITKSIYGFVPLHEKEIKKYLNKSLDKIIQDIGDYHADIGSGFYIPAYITDDGYLVYLELNKKIVVGITKLDLLTNKIIEKYPE